MYSWVVLVLLQNNYYWCVCVSLQEETHIDLTQYGVPHGYTAMAQCVSMPTASAARLILDGGYNYIDYVLCVQWGVPHKGHLSNEDTFARFQFNKTLYYFL